MFLGFPVKIKMKAYTKLTVVMCCQICDRKSLAPSSGKIHRGLQVTAQAGAGRGEVAAWYTGKMPHTSCLACSDRCRQKHGQ